MRTLLTPPSDNWAELPAHDFDETWHICVYCGRPQETETYAEYVESWYATEYEGPQWDDDGRRIEYGPYPEDQWAYLRDSCLNTEGV